MKVIFFTDVAGHWRWTCYADNGEALATSSESYVRKTDAVTGFELTTQCRVDTFGGSTRRRVHYQRLDVEVEP